MRRIICLCGIVTIFALVAALIVRTTAYAQTPTATPAPNAAPAAPLYPTGSCILTHTCIVTGGKPPNGAPAPGEAFGLLQRGNFGYTKTDLTIAAPIPIAIARVYRDNDVTGSAWNVRDFGIGTSINYGMYLYSSAEVNKQANPYANINVVLPNGSQMTCACSLGADCSTYQSANLTCAAQPIGDWFDSVLTYDSAEPGWDLTLKDGTVYVFGQGAPLQKILDRYRNSLTITRANGQTGPISQIAASNGRYVNFTYDSTGKVITQIVDNDGRTVDYTYNANDALITVSNVSYISNGSFPKTTYFYGAAIGDITEINLLATDSNGSPHENYNYITRGSNGKLATFGPDIGSNGFTYSYGTCSTPTGTGTFVVVGDPDGHARSYCFDPDGYLYKDTRAPHYQDEVTEYTRNSLEQIAEIADIDGKSGSTLQTTTFTYNADGDVTSVTHSPAPNSNSLGTSITSTFTYQGLGAGSLGLPPCTGTGQLYDRVTSITDATGNNVTLYCYDGSGNLISITDPKSQTSTYTYNTLGQLKTATTPVPFSQTTTYTYSTATDDLISVTDPLQNVTNFTTDALGRVTQVSTPMGHTASYTYDALNHVTSASDGNGNITSYSYDLMGLPLSMTDPNGNTSTITRPWTLNKETVCDAKNQCAVTDFDYTGARTDFIDKRGIKTVVTYDAIARPSQVNVNSTGASGYDQRTIAYTYDSLDRVTQMADSGSLNNTIGYQYDGASNVLLESVQASQSGTISYQYDADSRRTATTVAGGGGQQNYGYSYDADSELTGVSSTTLPATATIGYDSDGRRTSLTVGSVTTTYSPYDADSRLQTLTFTAGGNQLGQLNYTYDNDSRVVGESGSLAALNLPASQGPNSYYNTNQIESWNGLTPANPPDAANNLIQDPTTNAIFTWDSRNQLSGISGGPAGSFSGSYDARMRRYQQTTGFTGTTIYLHDRREVAQSTNVLGQSSTTNNYLTVPGTGEVLAFATTSGGVYVPIHDRLGSTIGLANAANALQTQYTYDPFGTVTTSGQASSYPYLFAGMELDASGLYHTLTRYYDPVFGRFLSADAGLPANPFAYAGDDPVNAVDPGGMSPELVAGAAGASPAAAGAGGGLGGAELAQDSGSSGCPNGDCSINLNLSGNNGGGLLGDLIDFFSSLFGGGGGGPAIVPAGYRRVAHYPAMYFISDAQADIQQFTPDLKQKSHAIEMIAAGVIIASIILAPEVDVAVAAVEGAVELGEAAESLGETTTLFRAVSNAEFTDVMESGIFRSGGGASYETGKFFAESGEDALRWGNALEGPGNFRVLRAEFPNSVADEFLRYPSLDGIGPARFATFEQLGQPTIKLWPGSP